MSIDAIDDKVVETAVMKRVFWRLMPFLLAAYLICYIDRVNVGFASLQMNKAVGIDPKTYGLGAGIWTKDLSTMHKLAAKIKAGTVWGNCHAVIDPALPFGGYKQSGIGREQGRQGVEAYTEVKTVIIEL